MGKKLERNANPENTRELKRIYTESGDNRKKVAQREKQSAMVIKNKSPRPQGSHKQGKNKNIQPFSELQPLSTRSTT